MIRINQLKKLLLYVFCCLTLITIQPCTYAADAHQAKSQPFQIKARLEPSTVMVGEPATIMFRFDGMSEKRTVVFAEHTFSWCNFEVFQKSTLVKSWKPNQRSQYLRSIYLLKANPSGLMDVSSGDEISVTMPTEVMNLPPGDYTLHITTKLPYNNDVEAKNRPEFSTEYPKLQTKIEVPFTVRSLDPIKMKTRVENLYRKIGREQDLNVVRKTSYELGMLPPKYARRAWRTLLFDKKIPGSKRYIIAQMLSAQATQEMAEVLLDVQYTDPIRDEDGQILTMLNYLVRMYNNSDTAENYSTGNSLRGYINKKMADHDKSPFNTPIIGDGPVM